MKRWIKTSVLVALVLSVTALPAPAAKDAPVVEPLQSLEVRRVDLADLPTILQACTVGNLNPLAFAITGFAAPPEEYALIFDPLAGCAECPLGFDVTAVHVFMRTARACTVVMEVGMRSADGTDPACPGSTPGTSECVSGAFNVNLPSGGIWDVSIPVDCPCADPGFLYGLTFNYVSSSCLPEPDLITDGLPTACTSWNDFGSGWVDLVPTFGFPGNLAFYADANCCEPPISTDSDSWGSIKGLFEH